MDDARLYSSTAALWIALAIVLAALVIAFFWYKGRPMSGPHVFRASRLSRGNLLFPTQVAVTPTSIVHFTPQLFGGREQSIHLAHVASVLIDRNLFFADVMIESSGGASPVQCHGHRKADAVAMKRLIEQFQSEYYRSSGPSPGAGGEARRPS
ncbi:MAG: hypothetical protein M3P13_00560 [Acidobacteriota bacterium]|nr:hypothetical protein [Acidobacteriota bacterium]